jgi:rubrerythrin
MAAWICKKCSYTKEGRCKPKKCPKCGANDAFVKEEKVV